LGNGQKLVYSKDIDKLPVLTLKVEESTPCLFPFTEEFSSPIDKYPLEYNLEFLC